MTMRMTGRPRRVAGWVMWVSLAVAGTALGQGNERIGHFAADVHGSTIGFKQTAEVAGPLDVDATNLPGRGFGVDVGAHVYPVRLGPVTLGLGGSVHVSRGHAAPTDEDGNPLGPEITARFTAYSPQVSFNFGHARGWSYLSGGIGQSTFAYTLDGEPADTVTPRRKTINYGGGARWYMRDHLAFSFDVRFYAINPVAATDENRASPRMTLLVLSAGISFK